MKKETFDLHVHTIDPNTRKVARKNPYRLYVRDKVRYFERPVGSGKFFYESGEEVPKEKLPFKTSIVK